jgi:PAS domain S-box-containing protein
VSAAPGRPGVRNAFDQICEGHVVQFYTDDVVLTEGLARFIGSALQAANGAIVIATKPHRESIATALDSRRIDVQQEILSARYVPLDAEETLSMITRDGYPDEELFSSIIQPAVDSIRARSVNPERPVAGFGEMVALLWGRGKIDAALRLEQLWNSFAQKNCLALRCAYPMVEFSRQRDTEMYLKVCAEHSAMISSSNHRSFVEAAEREMAAPDDLHAFETEAALRQSEERFRLFVDGVQDYAIFMLDTEGRVDSWNSGAERIKGYKASEIIGKHFSCFYPEDEVAAGKPQKDLEIAARRGRYEDEGWRIRKDGTRFYASLILTAVKDSMGRLRGFGKVTRDITERIGAERKLQQSEQSLRRLSGHLLRTQDEERRRLGRELHDSVGQYLAAVKMGLDSLKGTGDEGLDECIRLVEQSMAEIRTISYLLYPPMLEELGLRSAIPWYLEGFSKRSGIQIKLHIPTDFARLPRDSELALFRVLQESLTNVHRHSESKTAEIRLGIKEGTVLLEVIDQGKGVPTDVLSQGQTDSGTLGVGLRGMTERMRQLGGELEVISSDQGTTVRATIPVQSQGGNGD